MKIAARWVHFLASVILTFVWFYQVSAQGKRVAGIIEEIHGSVYWRKNAQAQKERLDPKRDRVRRVYFGEELLCDSQGSLQVILCHGEIRIPDAQHKCGEWHPILEECPNQDFLQEYGRPGGRKRSLVEGMQIFSPAEGSAVRPEQFSIRWVPGAARGALSLIMQEVGAYGKEIWRDTVPDAVSGYFISASAAQALVKYRSEVGQGPLVLRAEDGDGNESKVRFVLLSIQSEQSLEQEMARWNHHEVRSIIHRLSRAAVFFRYRMYTEVTEEYEAALDQAPESTDLLMKTIYAHRDTDNAAREEELTRRLPPGTKLP